MNFNVRINKINLQMEIFLSEHIAVLLGEEKISRFLMFEILRFANGRDLSRIEINNLISIFIPLTHLEDFLGLLAYNGYMLDVFYTGDYPK